MATTKTPGTAPGRSPSKRSSRQAAWRAGLGSAPGQYDIWLLVIVATLVGLGLVMVFSASFAQANRFFDQPTYYLLRQLQWAALGVVAMTILARTDYRILKRLSLLLMIGTLIVLLLVLILGTESLGSRRHLIGRSVQPSEVAKLTIIIYIAYWLSSKGSRLKAVSDGLLPFSVLLGMVALLIVLQPDIDTTALIVFTALVMFFVAGADGKQLAIVMAIAAAIFLLVATKFSYASQRMEDYMSFLRDPTLGSDQVQFALQALAQGGLFGTGLGSGQRLVQLPFTDSIFAVIGFELGLAGTLSLVALFAAFVYRGLRIALRCSDPFGLILGIGITAWIALQAFLNMAVNLAMLPFSGLTLPFISYGGSSLVACMAGVGVLLSISRHGSTQAAPAAQSARSEAPRALGNHPRETETGYATLTLGWRHWRTRLSHSGRARSARPGRATAGRRSASSRSTTGSTGYTVKTASASRADGLSRRVTRAKRTIARKTGASKRKTGSASNRQSGQRI
ncbi:MAG TPA: putative peptidoglycan glycosyltransferase FtsW, partial [Anaerolineae bacterium]|nr:putative peptidoglycan glycosyltransferase FtsW [Anaerolineae bacterium]